MVDGPSPTGWACARVRNGSPTWPQLEHLGPLAGGGTRALAALPPDEFPHTAANARHAGRLTADAEFTEGLHVLLRGRAMTP
ncbi:hypothetical protein [Cryptosporangium minutisporangium]|uniref:hypothetical protein n=1 Tax=Cryptosporangium minutisporangium TaxID=113569 RepID=UPI0031EA3FD7